MVASLNDASAKVKASTADYLKNQCYKNEPLKDRMRLLGGISPLVTLLSCEQLEVHLNACAALR